MSSQKTGNGGKVATDAGGSSRADAPPLSPAAPPALAEDTGRRKVHWILISAFFVGLFKLLFRMRWRGLENVPAEGNCLILSNHGSLADPVMIGSPLKRPIRFLARSGVVYAPVLGFALRNLFNTHSIRRGGIDREAIKTCRAILEKGWPLTLFPEGTRTVDGRVSRPRWGFGMILDAMPDVPCVPVYIANSDRAMGKGFIVPRPVKVEVVYGKPFTFEPRAEGQSRRDFYEQCVDRLVAEWRRLGADVKDDRS